MAFSLSGAASLGAGIPTVLSLQAQPGPPLLQNVIRRDRRQTPQSICTSSLGISRNAGSTAAAALANAPDCVSTSAWHAPIVSPLQPAHQSACRGLRRLTHGSAALPGGALQTALSCCGSKPTSAGRDRLQPPAASSGAASAGTSAGPGLHPQGQANAGGHPFNPRYHSNRYSQPHHQQHTTHQQHSQPAPTSSGRSAWATPGPLSSSGGSASISASTGAAPSNPRYDSLRSSTRVTGDTTPQTSPGDSRLVTGALPSATRPLSPSPHDAAAAAAATAASTSAAASSGPVSVSAAARGAPQPHQPGHQPGQPLGSNPFASSGEAGWPGSVRSSSRGSSHRRSPAAEVAGLPSAGATRASRARTQLERLYIRDFALVSEQTVCLGPGVNVITGESGSGKSVLVEAFSQVLGATAPQECVRAPAEIAIIEGTFLVGEEQQGAVRQLLTACGLPQRVLAAVAADAGSGSATAGGGAAGASDGSANPEQRPFRLTIRREISQAAAGGLRSRVFLNGAASSLRVLRELGALLVDTNGQHSSMSLRDPHTQLELLDRIAGTSPLADSYAAALARLRELEGRLDELDELDDEEERARMQKLVDAVAKLRIKAGEERELRRMLKKMEARRSAVEQCGLVRMALCGEGGAGGVTDALRTIEAQLNAILAQEEQNKAAAAKAKAKDSAKAADGEGSGSHGASPSSSAGGEDEAGEEEDEEGEEGGAAAGARMMEEALEQVALAKDMLAAADGMVRSYARRYQFSQADHDATSERLARIERLMKQATAAGFAGGGGRGARIVTTEQLLDAAAACSAKLATYYEMEGQRDDWESQLTALVPELRSLALQLSARRRSAAAALRSAVEGCLRELAMGGSRFDVRIGWAEERVPAGDAPEGLYVGEEEAEEAGVSELGGCTYVMGPRGLDQVEFLLAAGPAEPLRPLAAVASGGESARVMLALKAAPAQAAAQAQAAAAVSALNGGHTAVEAGVASSMAGGGVPIMILDELDSGIGARLGSAVGSILARMSLPTHGSNSQIICVTHLPQVACYAAHHIKVQKEQRKEPLLAGGAAVAAAEGDGGQEEGPAAAAAAERVTTTFLPLRSFEERCEEVAAMLGLDSAVAEDMLQAAQTQVAAMYPQGSAPSSIVLAPSTKRRGAGSGNSGVDISPRDNVVRVVQDTLRSSDVVSPSVAAAAAGGGDDAGGASSGAGDGSRRPSFMVSVSPMINPNAVLVSGAGASSDAAASPPSTTSGGGGGGRQGGPRSPGGRSRSTDEEGDEDSVEAELSARLLAGFEAAALEHLARMEAQAKAAAAAAAAAAAIVVGGPGSAGGHAAAAEVEAAGSAATQPLSAGASVGAAPGEVEAAAAAAAVGGAAVIVAAASTELGLQAGAEAQEVAERVALDSLSLVVAADEAEAATQVEVEMESKEVVAEVRGFESAVEAGSALASAAAAAEAGAEDVGILAGTEAVASSSSSAAGSSFGSFRVAVQPARPPLPYAFGGGNSSDEEDDEDYGSVRLGERGAGSAEGDHDDDDDEEMGPARQRSASSANGNGYSTGLHDTSSPAAAPAAAAGTWGNGHAHHHHNHPHHQLTSFDSPYMGQSYGEVPDGYVYNVGAPQAGVGGQFVPVPAEHEVEFNEMFQTIMSFSREDYEGEAMRTYEATLWQALKDSGMA